MKLKSWMGFRYLKWSKLEAICYALLGIAKKTGIALPLFEGLLEKARGRTLKMRYLDKSNHWFDFNGVRLPDVSADKEKLATLKTVFDDTLLIFCHYHDNYDKKFAGFMDSIMVEGPYGYVDGSFDVRVKEGDVVIDAGAWIGDFSAYSAAKGAVCYAFEPVRETFDWLYKTQSLNKLGGG
jgi:hypothetical protein